MSAAWLIDPFTLPSPPRGRGLNFLCAVALAFALLLLSPPAFAQQAYSVSVKAPDLGPQEKVAGFWIEVAGGSIRSVTKLPPGWVVNIDNLTGHVSIQGTLQEGAAAMHPAF